MIITNHIGKHKENLLNLFKKADEIIFAVGFLKISGLNNIKKQLVEFCSDSEKKSSFYIGTGLGETDPKTLEGLYNIIKAKSNHQLVLCTPDAGIFHPKIYVFRRGKQVTILVGSANLTNGGWEINDEVSMLTETNVDSPLYLQLMQYFKRLNKLYYVDDVADLIAKYKFQLQEFNILNGGKPSFRFKRKKTNIAGIDMPRLRSYYECYKTSDEFIEPFSREEEYEKAATKLQVLSSTKRLNALQFHDLFGPLVGHAGYKKLWHSGSIHRKTHKTLEYPETFRELVRTIQHNASKSIAHAFDNSIIFLNQKRKAKEISGIGVNIVTEIMLSFDPKKFANLNDNPIEVLALLGTNFKSPSSFTGVDYESYVFLLTKIKNELGMKSFLEIDSFFNYVYWNLLEE